ncbi:MAG: NADH-quinone oxidoreductase subunit NuoE [Thermodesulfobacteriota bacterium]
MSFPRELTETINHIIDKHETKQSSLIPVLRVVQNHYGWLSKEAMEEVSKMLDLPPSSIQNVATFYTMFFTKPKGNHVVWVCRTLSCALRGAEHVEHYLCNRLNIKTGETTNDGKITLMEAECLASCGTAPVMLVDDTLHENLTQEKVDSVIEDLKKD